ncbi:MAG TPA: tetratricopeptide repeat protein [Myxococcales bacterium]|nr:tetratricopeptide repeat protein [Myxococcales bacterium]
MNPKAPIEWLPAISILAAGLVFGAVLVWRFVFSASRAAAKTVPTVPADVRDLAGKTDVLIAQLRELEDTAVKRTPEQLARERYALELEAAHTLLALEKTGAGAAPPAAPIAAVIKPAAPAPDRASLRGFLWGVGSAMGGVLLVLLVYQSAKPREPGGSVTGELPATAEQAPSADGEEAEIKAALARDPNDAEARLALAHLYIDRQNWMGVWTETGKVLERAPGNPRALAYQSLVRMAMGQVDVGVNLLKKAIASDPDMPEAYAWLALGYVRLGRTRDADTTIASASKRFPDRAEDFRRYLAEAKENEPAVARASTASGKDPHATVPTPGEGPAPRAASGGRRVSGVVDLDPSLRSALSPSAVLFVFARPANGGEGPPVAAKRLAANFPASFELSEADSMMGQPFPDRLLIEARLDSDGDPTTRPPTDPKARLEGVKVGATGLRLILRRP